MPTIFETKEAIKKCAHTFSNGVTVVNTTPHDIVFLDFDETKIPALREGASKLNNWELTEFYKVLQARSLAERVIVPSDKACILSAKAVEKKISEHLVTTEFVSTKDGEILLDLIFDTIDNPYVVGSIIAMNAYHGLVVGMIPVPGFERVPPDQKRMRCDKFNIAM